MYINVGRSSQVPRMDLHVLQDTSTNRRQDQTRGFDRASEGRLRVQEVAGLAEKFPKSLMYYETLVPVYLH
jgi:hypothetical protein